MGIAVKGLLLVWIALVVTCAMAWKKRTALPKPGDIVQRVKEAPIQTETDKKPFTLDYRGKKYRIEPVANYDISGLVVAHNNINSMGDIYHDSDDVDIKDIAVIWGSNVSGPDYQRVDFSSNCYVVYWRYPRGTKFDNYEIANNHLLSGKAAVRDAIKEVRVGDQIRLKGMLVNYTDPSRRGTRKTSTTRRDTDMGACEVIYVDEVSLLKEGNPGWRLVYTFTFWAVISLAALGFISFAIKVWRDSRALQRNRDTD